MGYKVAVVGATGNVGREMLSILAEREFPADEVVALASRRSTGTEVSFGETRNAFSRACANLNATPTPVRCLLGYLQSTRFGFTTACASGKVAPGW